MANKVISIKMDEKDIDRLRKYYDVLIKAGFLSKKTMSMNAFYKHLLLDYLEDDVRRAFATYSNYGMSPRCINPDELSDKESPMLANTYNLSVEMFEVYKKCVKEALNRNVDEMNTNAEIFNKLVHADVIVTGGWMYEMECLPLMEKDERSASFWEEKVFETMDLIEQDFREHEIDGEIVMIKKSSIPEELKQKLINEIIEYEKKRKQNHSIVQGRGIIK